MSQSIQANEPISWFLDRNELGWFLAGPNKYLGKTQCDDPFHIHRFYYLEKLFSNGALMHDREKESFETIYKSYYSRVYYFFIKENVDEEVARELAQDVFLRVHQNWTEFRGETTFKGWLKIVTNSVWSNYLRGQKTNKRKGKTVKPEDWNAVEDRKPSPDPEKSVIKKELLELLSHTINTLPAKTKAALKLRVYHDLKYHEIAAILKVSVDTVKSQLNQAKRMLMQKLNKTNDICP